MVGSLLVMLVEVVELGQNDPRWERGDEDEAVRRTEVLLQGGEDDRVREGDREHVGEQKHPSHEPAARRRPPLGAPPAENLERALIRQIAPRGRQRQRRRSFGHSTPLAAGADSNNRTTVFRLGVVYRREQARI